MKTKLSIVVFILALSPVPCALSQIPQGFNYQAVARDGSGYLIMNTTLPVTITIQSDSLGGTILWEELHSSVITNGSGVFNLVIGKGARQASSTVALFSDIDWSTSPKFFKTQLFYKSALLNMGTTRLWSVPFSMAAKGLAGPVDKLEIAGKTDQMDEALFEVKNRNGQTVFAVYNEGVRVYVADGAKGVKGGFAVGGFGTDKAESQKYLVVTKDSTRVYVDNNASTKKLKGGFAVGGYDMTKGSVQNYLDVSADSIRVYIDSDPSTKKLKGGFAVGGYDLTKGKTQDYLNVNPDSVRIYIDSDNSTKKLKGGFAVGGYDLTKGGTQDYLNVSPDSVRIYIDSDNSTKKLKGGFAVGGFDLTKEAGNEYIRVTTDSVKVSRSLLIPRLTTEERDNLPFIPGEALIIFNMTEGCMQIFKNKVWSNIWCFNCAPDFLIQPVDQTICSGDTAKFFISATGTSLRYQWQESADNEGTWNTISNGGANPSYSGVNGYTLSLSDVPLEFHNYKYRCIVAGSCSPDVTSNVVTLSVGSTPPIISSQPTDQQLSTNCSAYFNISSPGYILAYKWQQSSDGGGSWENISDGGTSPGYSGVTTPNLSLNNIPISFVNYKYRCSVSNACGEDSVSSPATLTSPPSLIYTQPADQQLTTNCSAYFIIAGGDLYQWQVSTDGGTNWTNISNGGTSPVYSGVTMPYLQMENVPLIFNNYKFRCQVSSGCGLSEFSNAATLTVNAPPVITVQPANTLVYFGQNVSFTISTSGYSTYIIYQWQISTNGGSMWSNLTNGGSNPAYTGVNASTLSMSNVPLSYNNYEYRCIVSHYCCPEATSDAAILSVLTPALSVTDIEGNTYNTVAIGSQLWMAENLKTVHYNDNTPISLVIDGAATPGFCWYNNNEATYKSIYGALYNWYAINTSKLCPSGWHVPTSAEWFTLYNYLTNNGFGFEGNGYDVAKCLAATSGWTSSTLAGTPGNDQANNNSSGFTALPSGFRQNASFFYAGTGAYWWSITGSDGTSAYFRSIYYGDIYFNFSIFDKKDGLSVRCVKD